jgi:hypothetical protein
MATASLIFMVAFALSFYVLGATFVEGFVNYRTWHLIGAAEFKPYHRAIKPGVMAFVVFPFVLAVMLTGMLLWWLPSSIPRWSVWLSLALDLFAAVVSVMFQIPIQFQFDRKGMSLPLLRRLNSIEWLRRAAHISNSCVFLWMMARTMAGRTG